MLDNITRAAEWLSRLIAFDSRNGPGEELPLAEFLKTALAAHNPDSLLLGTTPRTRGRCDGAYVLAQWGTPRVLLNVHLDTVPSGEGWTASPHVMRREGDKLIGLGASDIKGAMACILAVLDENAPRDVAILFSGDEEQGSEVMSDIIAKGLTAHIPRAIVCEPTGCEIGRRHRGFISYAQIFTGPGGHSSLSDLVAAPVQEAARIAVKIADYGREHLSAGPQGYKGLCVNIGMIDGDGAHNVIPTRAELRFSLRPPPGDDWQARTADLEAICKSAAYEELIQLTAFAPFGTRELSGFAPYFAGQEKRPIDLPYWTEAAMLSEAGMDCVVFGPGDVEQAHRPNEFVTLDQLGQAMTVYKRALTGGDS